MWSFGNAVKRIRTNCWSNCMPIYCVYVSRCAFNNKPIDGKEQWRDCHRRWNGYCLETLAHVWMRPRNELCASTHWIEHSFSVHKLSLIKFNFMLWFNSQIHFISLTENGYVDCVPLNAENWTMMSSMASMYVLIELNFQSISLIGDPSSVSLQQRFFGIKRWWISRLDLPEIRIL